MVDFLFTVVGGCYHALNPAVYYYFNKNFRKATKSYFREEVCSALFVFSIDSLKQNAGSLWTPVFIQFFMLFHMIPSVLLSMAAYLTIFLLVEILQQPIRLFEISGY